MPIETALHEVLMPRASDTMTEGTLARWLKAEGDAVARGEAIAEVDTDKVTMELEAPSDGVLLRRCVSEGGSTAPGAVVAVIGPAGAELAAEADPLEAAGAEAGEVTQSASDDVVPTLPRDPSPVVGANNGVRLAATPLARRLAAEAGLELQAVGSGSGPNGRILRQDVEHALASRASSQLATDEVVPGRLQLAIARRMSAAKQEIPHYYLDAAVDVTKLVGLRAAAREQGSPLDVPLNAFAMRAVALALREFPRVNASWAHETIVRHRSVNVGLAVAVDDDGLYVPIVRDADGMSVAELAAACAELIAKARRGKLAPGDVGGGSFTISNLGMFGVDVFHAIINPPESGILAVGSVRDFPGFEDGRLTRRDVMQISLSADHRVYSGATAAAFLSSIRSLLEQPLRLL